MSNRKFIAIISVMMHVLFIGCTRHKMINYDVSYVYHPENSITKHKLFYQSDSIAVYISLTNIHDLNEIDIEEFNKNYFFSYTITPSHWSKEIIKSDSLTQEKLNVTKSNNTFYLSFKVPIFKGYDNVLMMVYRKDLKRSKTQVIDIALNFGNSSNASSIMFFDAKTQDPLVDNYINIHEKLIAVTIDSITLYVKRYSNRFAAAIPPHHSDEEYPQQPYNLTPDSTFHFKSFTEIQFTQPGLYFIQTDTTSGAGSILLVKENKFPQISHIDEMVEPLEYITTTNDFEKIKESENPKLVLDSFWLSVGGSKEYSRTMIRHYYEKVEFSNKVFTTYKEGWKTDKGMIFILFGKPDQVFKSGENEEWIYENILNHIVTFNFTKKINNFSADEYELVRYPLYENYWINAIEKWRNGIINK